jgi:hypothetical protein
VPAVSALPKTREIVQNAGLTSETREGRHMDEAAACVPVSVDPKQFNLKARLPYGLTANHIRQAMENFTSFLGLVNHALHAERLDRLESILMPANFSSIVIVHFPW